VKPEWVGKTLIELNLRKKYSMNVIAIQQDNDVTTEVDPNKPLESTMKLIVVANRNKLAMKATSIKVGTSDLTTFQEFGIYPTENAAKGMTGSIGTATTSDLKSAAGALLIRDNLADTTNLHFSYTDGSHVYVASAKANALHAGAALTFAQHEIPLSMQIEFGDGADRYGSGQAFTLTFTTNKTGKYVVTAVNFNGVSTGEFEAVAGDPIIVPCSHSSWSTQASIKVQFSGDAAGGTNPETFTGPVRNKLLLGKMTASSNAPADNKDVEIRNASNNSTYTTVKWSELKVGGVEVIISGLADINSKAISFRYTSDPTWENWYGTTYTTTTLTATQAMSGIALNFNK
jgi:hypothetical protein